MHRRPCPTAIRSDLMPAIQITVEYTPTLEHYPPGSDIESAVKQDIELIKTGSLSLDEFIEYGDTSVTFEVVLD